MSKQSYSMFEDTKGLDPNQMAYLLGGLSTVLDTNGVIRKGDVKEVAARAKNYSIDKR